MACADDGLSWYIELTGETPCETHERLQGVCSPSYRQPIYEIPKDLLITPSIPFAKCETKCCCNSISFSLTMLCLTCQHGSGSQGFGVDAAPGTYQAYLGGCKPRQDRSLPSDVQDSVCQEEIKLLQGFWDRIWWDRGDWYYGWTRNYTISENSSLHQCHLHGSPSTTSSTSLATSTTPSLATSLSFTTPAPSSRASDPSTASAEQGPERLDSGKIAGIIVGLAAFISLIIIAWWCWWKRRFVSQTSHSRSYTFSELRNQQSEANSNSTLNRLAPSGVSQTPFSRDADGYTVLSPGTNRSVWKEAERRRERLSHIPGPFLPVYER